MAMQITPVNELTNKAMLGLTAVIGTALVGIIGSAFLAGARAYTNTIYVQKLEWIDAQIEYLDRRAFEIDEIFMVAGDALDPATTRRLATDKAWYENNRTVLLRRRGDLQQQ